MLAKMQNLGVISSYSRPRVSNDNPYSESLYKTVKYSHQWSQKGFKNIGDALDSVEEFVKWYNTIHQHSGIKYLKPAERHACLDRAILGKRNRVYEIAKLKNPEKWSQYPRNMRFYQRGTIKPRKKGYLNFRKGYNFLEKQREWVIKFGRIMQKLTMCTS